MRHINATAMLVAAASAALATPPFFFNEPFELSTTPVGGVDGENASKGKLVRLEFPDGQGGFETVLVSVYADAQGPQVWGFDALTHDANDIFATRSTDGGLSWSTPVNISNTANLSSIAADHDGDPVTPPLAYFGDSEKPNIFNNGKNILVSWVDRYVPTGLQGTVVYPDSGLVEVPYAATYVVRSTDGGLTWSAPQLLSDGSRDAKQDVNRASAAGFVVTWQEDPKGLQPGEAEGPGEGGSGAKVSKGTDIWFTSLRTSDFSSGTPFPTPRRITDNFTRTDKDGDESGIAGASRANTFVFGQTAIVAYEETKGTQGLDEGKYIRYHTFSAFDDSKPDSTSGAGWILSLPDENARRVRFIVQPGPMLSQSDVRIVWLYKQGLYDQGGPSDIMVRVGSIDPDDSASTGLRPQDLFPPIDPSATTRAAAFNNTPGINLSSSMGLDALSDDNAFEDARSHRGVLRGDSIALGYNWTPDWAVARFTDLENYNFFMRTSPDGGLTWADPVNMSNIDPVEKINTREPRIVGTPFSSNPATPTNTDAFLVAWGTEINQYEHLSEGILDLDIFITRTDDFGETFAPVSMLTPARSSDDIGHLESQLRLNPAGNEIAAVWQMADRSTGVVNTLVLTGGVCVADFNHDGDLDANDFFAYLQAFSASNPSSDTDLDGLIDANDFFAYLDLFASGCP